jgi:hypothetical protein
MGRSPGRPVSRARRPDHESLRRKGNHGSSSRAGPLEPRPGRPWPTSLGHPDEPPSPFRRGLVEQTEAASPVTGPPPKVRGRDAALRPGAGTRERSGTGGRRRKGVPCPHRTRLYFSRSSTLAVPPEPGCASGASPALGRASGLRPRFDGVARHVGARRRSLPDGRAPGRLGLACARSRPARHARASKLVRPFGTPARPRRRPPPAADRGPAVLRFAPSRPPPRALCIPRFRRLGRRGSSGRIRRLT